jgi:hypothetical protein
MQPPNHPIQAFGPAKPGDKVVVAQATVAPGSRTTLRARPGRHEMVGSLTPTKMHATVIRVLAFKWQRIMWRCWQERTPYNEVYYRTMLQKRGSKLLKLIAEPVEKIA